MHACLNVDEIVRVIAYELVTSRGRGTAVSLACCCRGFEDPVLDPLWETQERLVPLFMTLPRDIWNEGGHTVSVSAPTTYVFSFLNRSV